MFRVFGLTSVGQLFPNLIVIRGKVVKFNYALVLYEVNQLQDIGLKSLISIQRGFVRIQNNPDLCFVNTVNWTAITQKGSSTESNLIQTSDFNRCPSIESCRGCEPKFCWSRKHCQRFLSMDNYPKLVKFKCHPQCLGGCTNDTAADCNACRTFSENGTCVDRCSSGNILDFLAMRCISKANCSATQRFEFRGECVAECPNGYSLITNNDTDTVMPSCQPCYSQCQLKCDGREVEFLEDAELLKGCTIITGNLQIRINVDSPDVMNELESYMGNIEEIDGYLKIYRSMSVSSLSFLRSLTKIHGRVELEYGKYGLVVYENNNLQTLWDWKMKKSLIMYRGSMFFHYNTKLCMSEIRQLQNITQYTNTTDFICDQSNGHRSVCDVLFMDAKANVVTDQNVTVFWKKYEPPVNHTLISYLINFVEAPVKDVTVHYGRDSCSK